MLKENNRLLRKAQLALDLAVTALTFLAAHSLASHSSLGLSYADSVADNLYLLYIVTPVWWLLLHYNRSYESIRVQSLIKTLWPPFKSVLMGGVILMTVLYVFKLHASRGLVISFLVLNAAVLVGIRVALYFFFHHIRKKGKNFRSLLIIGTGSRARAFVKTVQSRAEWGLVVEGFVDFDAEKVGIEIMGKKVLGTIDDISDVLAGHQVDEVMFLGPRSRHDSLEKLIMSCEEMGIRVNVACDFYPLKLSKMHLESLAQWPFLALTPPPHYGDLYLVKRALDVAFSAMFLALLSPALIAIAIAIKLDSRGPVLFKQKRSGLNGRVFNLLKFRTMVADAEAKKESIAHLNEMSGPVFKVKKDPRVTMVGGFLRKFSLDEVPQFINVLRGDMSIVGPRPPLPSEVSQYNYSQRRRLSVRPGLTCLWQVNGRNKIGFSDWIRMDLEYIDRWSLSLDLKIMLKTVPAVLRGSGS